MINMEIERRIPQEYLEFIIINYFKLRITSFMEIV